ncbi:acetate kinase [Levilactobacillus brevis]|jgi:acetate kinase|uniref:Acetate kinase n=1 Tax=Levilactobacillus brevis (strain ATCC 367 / BCRC 12310 / CIP 105137 / JCM 1170 / LMG 11437 / NCIMB 947 / NCTC 947) TaxID=387344 RepID=Q03Q44_LEVBA|nr:acetate kinase [Levilactobacillus brevis]ABJ64678.1 Acetate kinase [Levilactobacillus brevis ATCC 367]KWT48536.1 acetate kinase [Levilactobacillus brevis]KWU40667.1 acetate kinase [Levilactobacillus brevis]MCB4356240.1 acetate kinase [Levilactobacillus brevis]MCS6163438.1 acetate kinase [Levilactobacillus brevis]
MSEKILAINSGSSSLKFKLYIMPAETVLVSGQIERIGQPSSEFSYTIAGKKSKLAQPMKDYETAIQTVIETLLASHVIESKHEIIGVGHRISHGGRYYTKPVIVDEDVKAKIDELAVLSPLHNPVNLLGIKAFEKLLPDATEVAVFDTSFHHTIPAKAYMYALPYSYYKDHGIRRYGFHGPSHEYIAEKAAELFGKQQTHRLISCHLGNGGSLTAILDGHSVNSSMGFTPLAGIVMGTRSGDIDPEIIPFIEEEFQMDSHAVREMLNHDSGLQGLSGISNDIRDLDEAAKQGNQRAQLALDVYAHQIQQYIGAYTTDLEGLDTLVFTAGIGEHSALVRQMVCERLGYLGIKLDPEKNAANALSIEAADSRVKVAVIPTDEEIVIARDVMALLKEA